MTFQNLTPRGGLGGFLFLSLFSLEILSGTFFSKAQAQDMGASGEGTLPRQNDEAQKDLEGMPGWKGVQKPLNTENIKVPREFWQVLQKGLLQRGASKGAVESFHMVPVKLKVDVFSSELNSVLREKKNYRVSYKEGGGELDLFEYVAGRGPFNIRFAPDLDLGETVHLLYISDSPGESLKGRKWGNGCGRIYDLTEKSSLFFSKEGIHLTSSRRQYMHLMAGLFVFFQLVDEKLLLAYIKVEDARYPRFNCLKKNEA